jgi:putative transposase
VPNSFKHTIKNESAYFLTLTIVERIDVFNIQSCCETFIESLKYCQKHKRLIIFAYVIMPNHIHMVVNTEEPFLLKDVMRDLKKFTSKSIMKILEEEPEGRRAWNLSSFASAVTKKHTNYKFWQEGNHAIELLSEKFFWQKINYIHKNPVKARIVNNPEDWLYSSASNYCGKGGIIEVECLRPRIITK